MVWPAAIAAAQAWLPHFRRNHRAYGALMISRRLVLLAAAGAGLAPLVAQARTASAPEWLAGPVLETLVQRFPPPAGFQRLDVPADSFGAWLRQLPLRPKGEHVRLFDGRIKPDQSGVAAVVDIDVGRTDLQQCADAVIRLRAEYLRAHQRLADMAFHFTSGDRYAYADWLQGRRPVVRGNSVAWTTVGARADTRDGFRSWLDIIFTYAGSGSLLGELTPVRPASAVEPGDVLIQPGSPGHAVLIVDVVAAAGERRVLLAQSFMPAQNIHVVNNPGGGAWYSFASDQPIAMPEWTFAPADLRRFPAL
jgi:hypothetical protein